MNKKLLSLNKDERGVVSILVTVFLILLMTLIVLAMSQNSNREQRQSLDRQLSDQAFYNAESGINDVANYLYATPAAPADNVATGCNVPGLSATLKDIDGPGGVNKYTCLIYDQAPKELFFDDVSISTPKVVPIQTYNDSGGAPVNLANLTISWDDKAERDALIDNSCAPPNLPPSCPYAGVRSEIVRYANDRDALRSASHIGFFLPSAVNTPVNTPAPVPYPDNQGVSTAANCSGGPTVRRCSVTIVGINGNNFFLSLRSLYREANITVSGVAADGSTLRFKNSQIMIDSTGRANDVLRRIQVRIPASNQLDYPGFAIQTKESICKILQVTKPPTGPEYVRSLDTVNCAVD